MLFSSTLSTICVDLLYGQYAVEQNQSKMFGLHGPFSPSHAGAVAIIVAVATVGCRLAAASAAPRADVVEYEAHRSVVDRLLRKIQV